MQMSVWKLFSESDRTQCSFSDRYVADVALQAFILGPMNFVSQEVNTIVCQSTSLQKLAVI